MQFKEVSIEEFIQAIKKLPKNPSRDRWISWLQEYDKPGYYKRQVGMNRSAKFAYNHLTNPEWLLWLIEAAGIDMDLVKLAKADSEYFDELHKKCAAIRKRVPWAALEHALWKSVDK
jgi:hypothetical protein